MEIKQLYEEMQKTWGEMKAVLDRQEKEIKDHGTASAETKALIDKINAAIDVQEKRITAAEVKANRLPANEPGGGAKPSEAKTAFLKWARTGVLSPEEVKMLVPATIEGKALSVGDATQAGYLAPSEYVREIIKGIVEFSPIRSIARVRTTSAKEIQVPKRTGTFAAVPVAELATRAETTGLAYGLETIPAHEYYGLVDVSFAMLEDSVFDLEDELRAEFAEQFGVAEGTGFVNGTAVGQPEGFMVNAAVGSTNSGDANLITSDGMIDLFFALKDAYAKNATWVLKRATLGVIRKLKASGTGEYLWAPGEFGDQVRPTILGQPYVEATDMPAQAANAFPVAFGDFRRGYTIVDRLEMAVIRDPYTQAGGGKIRFHARKRFGGQVVVAEAIRKLKCAA